VPAVPPFSAVRQQDPESGLEVLVLRHRPRRDDRALEVRVAPAAGSNLYWLAAGGEQLLEQPASLGALAVSSAGTPIMFPSPNRVRDSVFEFEGRRFVFVPNSGANFIHGLVRRRPWRAGDPIAGPRQASVATWIDWDQGQPDFAYFPVMHRLTVTYTLRPGRLVIGYRVANRGPDRLPFGFGLHPWFRIPGNRTQVLVRVPATRRMESEQWLPTGRELPVAGTPFDLRRPTSLQGLALDDVYLHRGGRPGPTAPFFEWVDRGLRVTFEPSAAFTHFVVYTPPDRPVFCLENQTCSTDAHNLHARGFRRQAHLQVVDPGKTARGSVAWRVERRSVADRSR
jgi:aldose 1-epimerase